MRQTVKVALIGLAVTVALAGGAYAVLASRGAPERARLRPAGGGGVAGGTPDGQWVVARQAGSFVGFRVRERFGGLAAPSDAAGRSTEVSGTVTIAGGPRHRRPGHGGHAPAPHRPAAPRRGDA